MVKYTQGIFTPKNPEKYCGPNLGKIMLRSSWEFNMARVMDTNPSILFWSSESISIPYQHPFLKNKFGRPLVKSYVPDFFIVYMDKSGKKHAEIIEVKPSKENPWVNPNGKYPPRLQAIRAVNHAKWSAALMYCKKNGLQFRVITEVEMFAFARSK